MNTLVFVADAHQTPVGEPVDVLGDGSGQGHAVASADRHAGLIHVLGRARFHALLFLVPVAGPED